MIARAPVAAVLLPLLVAATACRTAGRGPEGGRDAQPIALVTLPAPTNPLVALRVLVHVGAADDPPGKEGLAALTAAMVGQGATTDRTWAETLNALYPMAGGIDFYGDKDTFVFTGMIHRDNLQRFAGLLSDQLLTPAFTEDDFRRHRQDALDHVAKTLRGNDDEELGKHAMADLLYANHPYGHPTRGTVAGLRAITLADVRRFYRDHYTQDRLLVGVAGGYPDAFADAFRNRFAALPARGAQRTSLPPAPIPAGRQVTIVQKNAIANAISIGAPLAVTRADDDFYSLTVARSYLGEHRTFNGVLMNEMRGKRGLNYGDYAYVENFIQDGYSTFPLSNIPRRQQHFEIWLRPVAAHNTVFALRQALFETERLIRDGIPAAGFESTRRFLQSYVALWAQDISQRLGYAMDARIYGRDVLAELERRLPTMTKKDVDDAIKRHLSTENLAIAIVAGDAAKVSAALTAGAPTPIVYDTDGTDPAVLEQDRTIERWPLAIDPGQVRRVKVSEMFER